MSLENPFTPYKPENPFYPNQSQKPESGNAATAEALASSSSQQQAADIAASEQLINEEIPDSEIQEPLPYGALDTDQSGQPYYGSGFKGWLRQTWADLFDPKKFDDGLDLSQEQYDEVDKFRDETTTKVGQFLEPLQEMGIDIEQWTGLGAEDFATAWTDFNMINFAGSGEKALGFAVSNTVRMTKDFAQRVAWGFLDGILGIMDYVSRWDTATNVAAREFAEEYTGKESPVPMIFDASLVASATGRLTQWYNMGIVAKSIIKGDRTFKQYADTVKAYRQASEMAYTMVYDKNAVDEYQKQLASGRDPGLIARDLQNPWVELAGSILGDPTTYLGMGIPTLARTSKAGKALESARFAGIKLPWRISYRIPEFGELMSPFFKVGRNAAEAKAASYFSAETKIIEDSLRAAGNKPTSAEAVRSIGMTANDVVERTKRIGNTSEIRELSARTDAAQKAAAEAAERAQKAIGTPNEARLKSAADEAAKKAGEALTAEKKATKAYQESIKNVQAADYTSIVLNVSSSKASKLGSDATMIISSLLTNYAPPQVIETLRTLAKWGSAPDVATYEKLALHPLGQMLLSARGRAFGSVLAALGETKIDELITKYGKDSVELSKKLFDTLDEMLKTLYVSVDDMADAARRVKKGGSRSVDDLVLAARYDALPAYVRVSNEKVFRTLNKIHGKNVQIQSLMYMGWNPGYAVRNVTGQSVLMAMDMGVSEAVRISGEAVRAAKGDITKSADNTEKLIQYYGDQLAQALIPIPSEIQKGIADVPTKVKDADKLKDVRALSQNIEKATSAGVIHKYAFDYIQKYGAKLAERAIKDMVAAGLPEELGKQLSKELANADYNDITALKNFFDKQAGNVVEDWREAPMPQMLTSWLRETGMLDVARKAQKEAKTPEEFLSAIKKIADKQTAEAMSKAADEAAVYGERARNAAPEVVAEHVLLQDEIESGKISQSLRQQENTFTGMVNAWQNADYHLNTTIQSVRDKLNYMAGKGQAPKELVDRMGKAIDRIDNWWHGKSGKYKRHNAVMDLTRSIVERARNGELPKDLWGQVRVSSYYNLSEIFPNIDEAALSSMTQRQFVDYVYRAYFGWGENFWNVNFERRMGWKLKVLQGTLEEMGSSLDQFAVQNLGRKNPLEDFRKEVEYLRKWRESNSIPKEIKDLYKAHPPSRTVGELIPDIDTVMVRTPQEVRTAVEGGEVLERVTSATEAAVETKRNIFDILGTNSKKALNQINFDRRQAKLPEYTHIREASIHELLDSHLKRLEPKLPAPYEGGMPSYARTIWEAIPGMKNDLTGWANGVADNWGVVSKNVKMDASVEAILRKGMADFGDKAKMLRAEAVVQAVEMRNKMLFDYEKTYLDLALGYLKPFGYWTNQAYKSTFELMLANPKYANWYMSVKEFQKERNSDKPEWYQQMVGMDVPVLGNVFMNLEANLNPIYSLTATDFNDPKRRVDYLTSTMDDIGKIGGANNTLINWAVAVYAYQKGETETAKRWAGRMLPQSAPLKAVLNAGLYKDQSLLDMLGIKDTVSPDSPLSFLRYGELDPLVAAMGGLDPYEEGRVLNQLAGWVEQGANEEERTQRQLQAIDAATQREGELWDMAVDGAIDQRGLGKVMGFMGGPAFQTRTDADVKIERFYSEYYQLMSSKNMMTPEQYRMAWDVLREEHPFMDVLLIGRQSGIERDEALAYNTFGRLPPGALSDIVVEAGIPPELVSKFIENKGYNGWSQQDIDNLSNKVLDLHAMLSIPSNATRQEWTLARNTYGALNTEMEKRFGKDIREKINAYYHAEDQAAYMDANPVVGQALDFQNAMIVNNPILSQYYGGINAIEQYWFSKVYDQLAVDYPNMDKYLGLWEALNLQGNAREAKIVYERYNIGGYIKQLQAYRAYADKQIITMGAKLPEVEIPIRSDFVPDSAVQSNLAQMSNQLPTWDELTSDMPDILQDNVMAYFQTGKELNYTSRKKLERIAEQMGFSLDEYLRYLGISLERQ